MMNWGPEAATNLAETTKLTDPGQIAAKVESLDPGEMNYAKLGRQLKGRFAPQGDMDPRFPIGMPDFENMPESVTTVDGRVLNPRKEAFLSWVENVTMARKQNSGRSGLGRWLNEASGLRPGGQGPSGKIW